MGTRSLLAVETSKGKIHVQYMQFDGNPGCKGYEYYTAILFSLINAGICNFVTKNGKPNELFRKRCLDFLNEYQYATYHSTTNNWQGTIAKDWNFQKDCWQEYEYMFHLNGDFVFDGGDLHYEIPWEITKAIADSFMGSYELNLEEQTFDDDAPTIFNTLFSQLNNYDEKPYMLEVESGEILAFPDQKDKGWRKYSIIKIKKGNKIIESIKSSFASKDGKKRNKATHKCFAERCLEEA